MRARARASKGPAPRLVLAACGLAGALACSDTHQLGSVMLAISTDMYVDKDVSRVDIIVQPEHGPAQSTQVNLFPALEGRFLPGTFSIIEGNQPGEFVRVRLIARQNERARVVREAALKVPRQRTALLSMPMQWLCDGQIRQDGDQTRSDCEEGYTCIGGTCKPDAVEEALLPTYQSEDVYGGGSATGGGDCFDTLPCFEQSEQPALDLESCLLDTPPSEDLNVAAVLPPGSDGHCTDSACWIPLDASPISGWSASESGDSVQLPEGLCARVLAGTANVRVSHLCPSKAPSTPTCGPWTLVGTEPGEEPGPDIGGPGTGASDLGQELSTASQELALEVARACASLVQASPPAAPTAADLNQLCAQASAAVAGSAPLTWYHLPARCWPDGEQQLSCEAACASDCNPGALIDRCEIGSLAGACDGSCDSRQCLGSAGAPSACAGACDGNFTGTCEGNCLGRCEGICATPLVDGNCDGPCDGTCTGLCSGRGEGSCEGRCDADPMLPAPTCSAGTLCLWQCSSEFSQLRCASVLGTSPCAPSGCLSDCGALARLHLSCDAATTWLLPKPGLDGTLAAAVPSALGNLLTIRDARSAPALDEATRLLDRLSANAGTPAATLASAQAAIDLLNAVQQNSANVLTAAGPARQGPGGTSEPAAFSCDVKQSSGMTPLIDDFEDGDSLLLPNDGRDGFWHVGQDGTGTLTTSEPPVPEAGGANGSTRALHLAGSGFTQWGANLNVELRNGAAPYDASVHGGIKFWAKGTGSLRVILMQQNLAPGHPCSTCDTTSGECGQLYSAQVFLSDVWSPIVLDWTSFTAPTVIDTPFAPDQLMTIQFEVPPPGPVDLWIDDVAFY